MTAGTDTLRSRVRVRAPELVGRGWLNTGGASYSVADFRGRVLVLDFWTFCCVNCLHVLDELRAVEERFPDVLTIVGVHSPKFEHEADADALAAAVERYAVHHPVLDDPELVTWRAYTARAWPTLVVVDPEGYVVASLSGEGHGPGLAALVAELVEEHAAKGTLQPGDDPYVAPPAADTALRFPGKAVALPDGSVVVSDTADHEVVHLAADLETELGRWGGPGVLAEPQGVLLATPEVADRLGIDVLVADSVNHRIVGIRLADGSIHVVAGTGAQLRERSGGGPALEQDLSTPWDLAWFEGRVVIAMAGTHQLWSWTPGATLESGTVEVLAGTTNEGLRDGAAADAWFAQPSGLATSADGTRLWVADSETSSLRSLTRDDGHLLVRSHVGTGLFDFGHRDGAAADALLQHPLGVTVVMGRDRSVPNLEVEVEALRSIMAVNRRAAFEFVVTEASIREVDARGSRSYATWVRDVLNTWLVQSDGEWPEAPGADQPGSVSFQDWRLLLDALSYRCEAFLTMERRLFTQAPVVERKAGIRLLRPTTYWDLLVPWAPLYL